MSEVKDTLLMNINDDYERKYTDDSGLLMYIGNKSVEVNDSPDNTLLKSIT